MVLVAGQYDAGPPDRASGQSAASKLSCGGSAGAKAMFIASTIDAHRLLGDRQLAGLVVGQQHRKVAAALLDLLEVDRRARRPRRR